MFDPSTIELMLQAPQLKGLDLAALPKSVTEAYAAIVTTRIRLRSLTQARDEIALPAEIENSIEEMRRLAFTQEALVAVAPDRDDRAAAAFVAGTAHYVVMQAEKILEPEGFYSSLNINSISSEVSSALLFLAADAMADAAEAAELIRIRSDAGFIEAAVLESIKNLARGQLSQIIRSKDLKINDQSYENLTEKACASLYMLLHRGIKLLAAQILGVETGTDGWPVDELDPVQNFRDVESLSVRKINILDRSEHTLGINGFAGPSHLASLLIAVGRQLPTVAVVNLPSPSGVDRVAWRRFVKESAKRRPYLWKNHRTAIEKGYLISGASSVISFPTGAGKSTLSELKIAVALLKNKQVVFLVPTLALVDQTTQALRTAFPNASVEGERSNEESNFGDELPEIAVMTPERCLTLLGFNPSVFSETGLLVFDECHLLHADGEDRSRRAVDAMLCVLHFTSVAHQADLLLLSAMVKNTDELAEWLENITNRPCLALDLDWKPTRQVRGCVLYDSRDIKRLQQFLYASRITAVTKTIPNAVKKKLVLQPHALFCLHQTWQSSNRDDYSFVPLLEDQVPLGAANGDRNWYLTPNANVVAARIAFEGMVDTGANKGSKILIFSQTIPNVQAICRYINIMKNDLSVPMTDQEQIWFDMAVDEMGDEHYLYAEVNYQGEVIASCLPHHALLLPFERNLHESLYRRGNGVGVLAATSTLAQGMNLPSQIVIIAGDSRFNSDANQLERLKAHELLNAAGRAGRAGESSHGMVLIIPSKVVYFDQGSNEIHDYWHELKSIFAQSDQCLPVEDPLQRILDRIQASGESLSSVDVYFLRRLPLDDEGDVIDENARHLLRRSMGAFFGRKAGNREKVEKQIESALKLRRKIMGAGKDLHWSDEVAVSTGFDVDIVREFVHYLQTKRPNVECNVVYLVKWFFDWLREKPEVLIALMRQETMENFFGKNYKNLKSAHAQGVYALPIIEKMLGYWMDGVPLVSIEEIFRPAGEGSKCLIAREFVLRLIPDLSYIFSLPCLVDRRERAVNGNWIEQPAPLVFMGSCIKYGYNSIDMWALHVIKGGKLNRRKVHRDFEKLSFKTDLLSQGVPVDTVMNRVRRAVK